MPPRPQTKLPESLASKLMTGRTQLHELRTASSTRKEAEALRQRNNDLAHWKLLVESAFATVSNDLIAYAHLLSEPPHGFRGAGPDGGPENVETGEWDLIFEVPGFAPFRLTFCYFIDPPRWEAASFWRVPTYVANMLGEVRPKHRDYWHVCDSSELALAIAEEEHANRERLQQEAKRA